MKRFESKSISEFFCSLFVCENCLYIRNLCDLSFYKCNNDGCGNVIVYYYSSVYNFINIIYIKFIIIVL